MICLPRMIEPLASNSLKAFETLPQTHLNDLTTGSDSNEYDFHCLKITQTRTNTTSEPLPQTCKNHCLRLTRRLKSEGEKTLLLFLLLSPPRKFECDRRKEKYVAIYGH